MESDLKTAELSGGFHGTIIYILWENNGMRGLYLRYQIIKLKRLNVSSFSRLQLSTEIMIATLAMYKTIWVAVLASVPSANSDEDNEGETPQDTNQMYKYGTN